MACVFFYTVFFRFMMHPSSSNKSKRVLGLGAILMVIFEFVELLFHFRRGRVTKGKKRQAMFL